MSTVHEQARTISGTNEPNGMTNPPHPSLSQFRQEFFELVDAIVRSSTILQTDTADLDQDKFRKDVQAIHTSSGRLHDMAREFYALSESEDANEELIRTLRHDMLNALNVIIGYSEEWIEDCEEEFLHGFLPDLKRLHGNGKQCLTVLTRIRAAQQSGEEPSVNQQAQAAAMMADALYELEIGQQESKPLGEPGLCLVVDDDPKNRDILSRQLLRQGHKVDSAVNGKQALEKIRANNFDLVFLDIMMPEMNGFQVLHYLKSDEQLRGLPVIVISGLEEIDVVARCISMGAEDYLPKPFNPILLKARTEACLEKKRFGDREKLYLRQIEHEKQRSDELLHVILPGPIVEELKTTNAVKPRRCQEVAVLFADLVGFTSYCGSHSAEEVVVPLQNLVETWENSALSYGVEKIKTIGDAFMAAAGLLNKQENPVLSCVRCGLEMIEATQKLPGVQWNLRVGIHVGEVVAGVIGKRQYLFDLWGDTVNTAARMESNGKPGLITLTEDAWKRIDTLARGERDQVAAKGKGQMVVYRLTELLRE